VNGWLGWSIEIEKEIEEESDWVGEESREGTYSRRVGRQAESSQS
jgi:hypothetical protein